MKLIQNITLLAGVVAFAMVAALSGCKPLSSATAKQAGGLDELREELQQIADSANGKVGIALIDAEGDTITVNNDDRYPMMSVFKLHESLAVAHELDKRGVPLDTIISFTREEMNPDTWSPMLKDYKGERIALPVSELLRYIIQESDNNASNLLFDRIVSTEETDRFIRQSTGIEDFEIKHTEAEMQIDHSLAEGNHSSPMACARLIKKVFTDSLVSPEKQRAIQGMLLGCQTGTDRLYVPLKGVEGVKLAHKTGSGYRDAAGRLKAHNDVGWIILPDGRSYALAVLVKDFDGPDSAASALIARVSATVYHHLTNSRKRGGERDVKG